MKKKLSVLALFVFLSGFAWAGTIPTPLDPPIVSVFNLAGDPSEPYIDSTNDYKTDLALNIQTEDGISCKYNPNTSFDPATQGTTCITNPSSATCELGDLGENSYIYYYSCNNINAWSTPNSISFLVNLTLPPTVQIADIAGDAIQPYIDSVNDNDTNMVLNITSLNADQCKYSNASFNPATGGTLCTLNSPASATCVLGNLPEAAYTRFYACMNVGGWSGVNSVNFNVAFALGPNVAVNNLAGDTTIPYKDSTNDNKTDLNLNITTADATQCRFANIYFNPEGESGSYCTINNPSSATCAFGSLTGIPQTKYTYYYTCKNSTNWSTVASIDFNVDFTPPTVTINNLAGDTTAPYKDNVNDSQTNLALNITSGNATECKYSSTAGFNPTTQGTACTTNPSNATCAFGSLTGIPQTAYKYYYACKNTTNWSTVTSIDFNVDFTSIPTQPPTVTINNLAGDSSYPYIDSVNDSQTNLVLNITSGDATECRFFPIGGFNPATEGTLCTTNPSSATCTLGNLSQGNYSRYYACKNSADLWSSTNAKIDFTIAFTVAGAPIVTINNLATDTTSPYVDSVNDSQTNLVLNVTYTDGNPIANPQCRYSTTPGFAPLTGTACTPNPSNATCGLGNLAEGAYTYYYSCVDPNTNTWSSSYENIVFSVSFQAAPLFTINNLAGDTSSPYADIVNDHKTIMSLNITSGIASDCEFSADSSFTPGTNGTNCMLRESGADCNFGDLVDGAYTRYFSCRSSESWWATKQNITFDVNLLSGFIINIVSPIINVYTIGSMIDFNSSIQNNFFNYTLQWDSNKDEGWGSKDKNFSSDGLSIGDHNITLTAFVNTGGTQPKIKKKSKIIYIVPIPSDVLGITSFNVSSADNPITVKSTINITATIKNYLPLGDGPGKDANIVLTIINAETGKEVLRNTTKNPKIMGSQSTNISYQINLTPLGLKEGNYKVKLDVREYLPEQNTENNHKTEIITVLKEAPRSPTLTEVSIIVVPLLVIVILAVLNKRKIKEYLEKRKTKKQ